MPAVLVEAGFIDNPADNVFFDENLEQIAQAIAQGVADTFQEMERPVYYQIQTGAFQNRNLAEQMERQLKMQGFPGFLVYEDGLYKVRAGAFLSLDNAVNMEQRLRQYGYSTVMIRPDVLCVLWLPSAALLFLARSFRNLQEVFSEAFRCDIIKAEKSSVSVKEREGSVWKKSGW